MLELKRVILQGLTSFPCNSLSKTLTNDRSKISFATVYGVHLPMVMYCVVFESFRL